MSEKRKATRSQNYEREKNRIRGIVSVSTQRSKDNLDSEALYREGVRKVLLESRRKLADNERIPFLKWVNSQRAEGVPQARNVVAYDLVRPLIRSKQISFESELDWVIARLSPHLAELRDFRSSVERLNDAFWAGQSDAVWEILSAIEEKFGQSIWSIELALGLSQQYRGLEGQKAYLKAIKAKWRSGLPAYLAHFFSIRNEDRSTIRLFRDDARERIAGSNLFDQAQIYLRYKIADDFGATKRELSAVLQSEQLQSIIDLYETSIDLIQRLIKTSRHQAYQSSILKCTDRWSEINDFRLAKIEAALGRIPKIKLQRRSAGGSYRLATGDAADGQRMARLAHFRKPSDIWAGIENVLTSDVVNRPVASPEGSPWVAINDALGDALKRTDDFQAGFGFLEKFSRNFRCLYGAAALGDFASLAVNGATGSVTAIGATALNTTSWGPEDLVLAKGNALAWLREELSHDAKPSDLAPWTTSPAPSTSALATGFSRYLTAIRLLPADPAAALTELQKISGPLVQSLRGFVYSLRIALALHEGERQQAVRDIANEAAHSPGSRGALPVEAAIADRDWRDLSASHDVLDLAICLDVMWRKTDDDLYGSFLRFAFEDLLASKGCHYPRELSVSEGDDRERLIYFLRYIAVPQVMDLTGLFETSRQVVEERIAVCELLKRVDTDRYSTYDDEVYEIQKQLLIQDGLRIVDLSRINVDTAAVSRWAEQRYKESFGRYRALVESGIGVANDFDEVLRRIAKSPDRLGEYFDVPDNEADTLLLEMVIAIRDQFLNNPEHGLEFFLGKRIRHGTVTGHLRGPVENAKLITTRESEATDYSRNADWLDQLTFDNPTSAAALDRAFRDFSQAYDEIARNLKDERLHVTSKQHPKGVFNLTISSVAYQLIRSAVKTDLTFEGFLASCYAIFWSLLEPSLDEARQLLSPGAKDEAAELFDKLQNDARLYTIHDEAYQQLTLAIRTAASDVQRQFDSMAEWLRRTEITQAAHRFELSEIVDIALESTLRSHSTFEPKITLDVEAGVSAPVTVLVILSDIILVIVGNACLRSHSGPRPQIHISCHVDPSDETLVVDATNTIGDSLDRAFVNTKLDAIRKRIERGDIQSGALADSGSGLMKIANITKQSKRSRLSFGFRGDREFHTHVRLSIMVDAGGLDLTPAIEN